MAAAVSRIFWYVLARILSYKPIASWIIRKFARPEREFSLRRDDGSLYMGRWWIVRWDGWLRNHLPALRLHNLADHDRDANRHDHPWPWRTIVLRGGYLEEVEDRYNVRGVGSTTARKASEYHRIASVQKDTWTLFITGPWENDWGFLVDGQKIPHDIYNGGRT